MTLTLDTGALIALEGNDRKMWTALRSAVESEELPIVPTVVVAQAWRGQRSQALLARALNLCSREPLSDDLARVAGVLCRQAGTSDIVDAVVVASAATRGDVVLTSDPIDLKRLAACADGGLAIVRVGETRRK